jgi:heme-degrading monooxygenase HmoA
MPRRVMFARVISAQVEADRLDSAVAAAQQQLPAARQQPGFKGFYLLADRTTGKLMTISLWETQEHLQAVEAHAAQIRARAASDLATAPPPVDAYEVVITA